MTRGVRSHDLSKRTSLEITPSRDAVEQVESRKVSPFICSQGLDTILRLVPLTGAFVVVRLLTCFQMAHHAIPEMLRLSLQDLALRIKVLKIKLGGSIEEVLSKALDPPSAINIQRAVASLVEVKALTPNEEITAMGRMLSKLPMDVHLGKFLLTATLFKCLDPALTIAATLNSKSPFVTPFGFEAQADSAKRGFAVGMSIHRCK